MEWISIDTSLPEEGQHVDIWVKEHDGIPAMRRTDYVFVDHIGINNAPAFQEINCNNAGLYEMAFYLHENIVTHWLPYSPPPQKQ